MLKETVSPLVRKPYKKQWISIQRKKGRIVLINDGTFISGTILLKDNVTFLIKENEEVVGSSNPQDYRSIDNALGQERETYLVEANWFNYF